MDTINSDYHEVPSCHESDDNFSCNARSDILDKYSRFQHGSGGGRSHGNGKTETKVTGGYSPRVSRETPPDPQKLDTFRHLLFQINPDYITCSYKQMFEAGAVNHLVQLDDDWCLEDDRDALVTRQETSEPSSPRDLLDRSNSCSSTRLGSASRNRRNQDIGDLNGWEVCRRPHTASGSDTTGRPTRSSLGLLLRHGHSANARMTSPASNNSPASIRQTRGRNLPSPSRSLPGPSSGNLQRPRDATTAPKQSGRQDDGLNPSGVAGASRRGTSSGKTRRKFSHFARNSNYMDQYRNEFTYRRLSESRALYAKTLQESGALHCSCGAGNQSCVCYTSLVTASATICSQQGSSSPSLAQGQGHPVTKVKDVKESMSTSVCAAACFTPPTRVPVMKKLPLPKRPPPYILLPDKEMSEMKKQRPKGCYKLGTPHVGLFTSPIKVNSYRPGCSQSSSTSKVAAVTVGRVVTPKPFGASERLNQNAKGS